MATFDMNSEEKKATITLYEALGGEDRIHALVEAFYDLMDLEPRYAVLRAVHGTTLENARQRLFWYLCGWTGGPSYYTDRFGHPMLRARHLPQQIGGHSIGIVERDQWLACMDEAMGQIGVDDGVRAHMREVLFGVADWMRNRPE